MTELVVTVPETHHRWTRAVAAAVVLFAAGVVTTDADVASGASGATGCHGLSPASAQDCTGDQVRAALEDATRE